MPSLGFASSFLSTYHHHYIHTTFQIPSSPSRHDLCTLHGLKLVVIIVSDSAGLFQQLLIVPSSPCVLPTALDFSFALDYSLGPSGISGRPLDVGLGREILDRTAAAVPLVLASRNAESCNYGYAYANPRALPHRARGYRRCQERQGRPDCAPRSRRRVTYLHQSSSKPGQDSHPI
ncbi:hypothetical protein CYLTODRAFT_216076 [Cylindrobasidium torrendii FP15055 ss-10]|uniref:Uncharacterized protein n=1 Tax=Cylindrobasidium torrendii FP15055 ss-10 TaxID=1314674 RepID=A0A0D7AU43_9AGAR|nr:hypothetical protein CYLTODRAFT_216076 [Cylindrobasidium torrendii FP15055 ss-10]